MKTRIGFLGPVMVTQTTVVNTMEQNEANLLHSLLKMQSETKYFYPTILDTCFPTYLFYYYFTST